MFPRKFRNDLEWRSGARISPVIYHEDTSLHPHEQHLIRSLDFLWLELNGKLV